MRRPEFAMTRDAAYEFLERASVVRLAGTTAEGAPLLRSLNAVVLNDAIYFHGSLAGEKFRALGRPCVVQAEETVATIPTEEAFRPLNEGNCPLVGKS